MTDQQIGFVQYVTCKNCGKELVQNIFGNKIFCNQNCRMKWRYHNCDRRGHLSMVEYRRKRILGK